MHYSSVIQFIHHALFTLQWHNIRAGSCKVNGLWSKLRPQYTDTSYIHTIHTHVINLSNSHTYTHTTNIAKAAYVSVAPEKRLLY